MSVQRSLHVHVVDDEPVIAWTLAAILESHGYKALSFTSPFKSLEAAAATAPHILITDVSMPGMNGVELAIRIKKLCPDCKILLFSGQASTADLLATSGHYFDILTKPIHPAALLTAVESLCAVP